MKAFLENLSGIVRVGPEALRYGCPWEYCATYVALDPRVAFLKGFRSDGGFRREHLRAAVAVLKEVGGFLEVDWERIKQEGKR